MWFWIVLPLWIFFTAIPATLVAVAVREHVKRVRLSHG